MDNKELIIRNLETGSHTLFTPFVLSIANDWINKPLRYWYDILYCVQNNPISLYLYIPFSYKYLGINLIPTFMGLNTVNDEAKRYVEDSLKEELHWLGLYPSDIGMIKRENKSLFSDFVLTKKRLTDQGAIPVHILYLLENDKPPLQVNRDDLFSKLSFSIQGV